MTFTVDFEREDDGRSLAEVLELPGVLAYGQTSDEAIARAQALALRAVADRLEHGEAAREFVDISFARHEPVVLSEGQTCSRRFAPNRLDH